MVGIGSNGAILPDLPESEPLPHIPGKRVVEQMHKEKGDSVEQTSEWIKPDEFHRIYSFLLRRDQGKRGKKLVDTLIEYTEEVENKLRRANITISLKTGVDNERIVEVNTLSARVSDLEAIIKGLESEGGQLQKTLSIAESGLINRSSVEGNLTIVQRRAAKLESENAALQKAHDQNLEAGLKLSNEITRLKEKAKHQERIIAILHGKHGRFLDEITSLRARLEKIHAFTYEQLDNAIVDTEFGPKPSSDTGEDEPHPFAGMADEVVSGDPGMFPMEEEGLEPTSDAGEEKAFVIAYHGTSPEIAEKIKREGFRPGSYFATEGHLDSAIGFGGPFIFAVRFDADPKRWHNTEENSWQFHLREWHGPENIIGWQIAASSRTRTNDTGSVPTLSPCPGCGCSRVNDTPYVDTKAISMAKGNAWHWGKRGYQVSCGVCAYSGPWAETEALAAAAWEDLCGQIEVGNMALRVGIFSDYDAHQAHASIRLAERVRKLMKSKELMLRRPRRNMGQVNVEWKLIYFESDLFADKSTTADEKGDEDA